MIEIKFIRVMDVEDNILEEKQTKVIKQDFEGLELYKTSLISDKRKQYKRKVVIDFMFRCNGPS